MKRYRATYNGTTEFELEAERKAFDKLDPDFFFAEEIRERDIAFEKYNQPRPQGEL